MTPVRFSDAAYREMLETASYYNRQSHGLGNDFLNALEQTLERIRDNPLLGRVVHQSMRRRLVGRWPYSVLYQVEAEELVIYAIMHHKRKPDYWHKRLDDA